MRNVRFQIEAMQIRHVVKGHAFNVEAELAFLAEFAEGSVAEALPLSYFQLALVALFLKLLPLQEWYGVCVLVPRILAEFVGVKSVLLP